LEVSQVHRLSLGLSVELAVGLLEVEVVLSLRLPLLWLLLSQLSVPLPLSLWLVLQPLAGLPLL